MQQNHAKKEVKPRLTSLSFPLIGMGVLGLAVGAISASFYTLAGMNGFVKKENEKKVKKVQEQEKEK